jgi:lysophospholipase L1-like esterase
VALDIRRATILVPLRRAVQSLLAIALIAEAMLGIALLSTAPVAAATPVCRVHWVGSWVASPSDPSPSRALADQTLRMIIAPHLGGSTVRIHLSNRFGVAPVQLGPVTLGVEGRGPELASAARTVTFAGHRQVTIRGGGEALSDSVAFRFRAFQSLAISVYVKGTVTSPTEHAFTRQTSYLTPASSGDYSASASGRAFTQRTTGESSMGWYFLDGLDVQAPGNTGAVVTFGDSITDGFEGNLIGEQLTDLGTNGRYPDDLQRRLISARAPLSVLNAGISGDHLLNAGLGPTPGDVAPRFTEDALKLPGVSDVIVLLGINDLGRPMPTPVADLIAGYQHLIREGHAAGIRIQLGTLTPAGGNVIPNYGDAAADQRRREVNGWIRSQHSADGVIDFDAAVRDPRDTSRIDPLYDDSDHLHLSLAGYRAMAGAVRLRQLRAPVCVSQPVLAISVPGRSFTTRRAVTLRVRVTSIVDGRARSRAGARVTLGGQHAFTDHGGRVILHVRFHRSGLYTITASARGASSALLRVQVR